MHPIVGGQKNLGYGKGYKYPHDFENSYIPQQYLPDEYKYENTIILQIMDMKKK